MDAVSKPEKIALVTGATRGIGLAISEELSRDHVILVGGRSAERTELIAQTLPNAIPFIADLAKEDELKRAVEEIVAPLGRLDVLVNNAGVGGGVTCGKQRVRTGGGCLK